jgi:phosphate transport system substrate-binding protein
MRKRLYFLYVLAGLMACHQEQGQEAELTGQASGGDRPNQILAAGATFPYPLYSKMFDVYSRQGQGVQVNFQAVGSGGGIRQLLARTIDFGATDAYMEDQALAKAGSGIVHVPTCLGAVVVTYNLPGDPVLNFTPEVLAGIFLGDITKWNDPRITVANPGLQLPDMYVLPVHRSDGSGTTFIFTDYLTKVSPDWAKRVGREKSVRWLTGLGAKGNPGVTGFISQTPGSIGYVELLYAAENNLTAGALQDQRGKFIQPSLASTALAADTGLPPDTRVSLTNTEAPGGYPMASFTWLILYQEMSYNITSAEKARTIANLLWWMTHEGQEVVRQLNYSPLPPAAVRRAEQILTSLTFRGRPVLPPSPDAASLHFSP